MEAHRRIAFLIAEKSMKQREIGTFARWAGALPVGRAQDSVKPAQGKIYLPDPTNDPTLLRGVGTKLDSPAFQVGGMIYLPTVDGQTPNSTIAEIISAEEIRLKNPFKGKVALKLLTGKEDVGSEGETINGNGAIEKSSEFEGTSFKVAPHIDQTKVYNAVFDRLNSGGCVGIFPEGGSHDRTDLLPLKGVSLAREFRLAD